MYETFIKDIRESMVTKDEFNKMFASHNILSVELDMLKQKHEDIEGKMVDLKRENMSLRDQLDDKISEEKFIGKSIIVIS